MKNLLIACVFLGLVLSSNSQLRVQTTTDKVNWPGYQDMAVDLMRQYLRINTSNPPGNEIEAAEFFKSLFNKYGIQNEIFEYKPGRANIIARLKGNGSKRPIFRADHRRCNLWPRRSRYEERRLITPDDYDHSVKRSAQALARHNLSGHCRRRSEGRGLNLDDRE